MLPCFDPTLCLHFWDWFLVGKWREFGLVFLIEVVAAFVNLMLGLLNHLNWTSTAQFMVPFPGLPHLRLFNSLWDKIMACFMVLFGVVYGLC